jgi:putative heme-binding domain-containing protein
LFGSTANGNPSVYLPIPNRYYEQVRGWSSKVLAGIAGNAPMHPITDKVRQVDFHGRFTAAAGHALYTARTYPKEYWNRTAFVCEPTGHLVATFAIDKQGADFKSRNAWNLLASDDEWCSPIMAEVGPDGNVWVIDWYNYIVQHNPTPAGFKTGRGAAYETELRDKKHGRIYRLVMKGRAGSVSDRSEPSMTLKDASPEKLVATLKHDNLFWRKHAQRLLVERRKLEVIPALARLAHDPSVDAIGLNVGAIHAFWTLHGLQAFNLDQNNSITVGYTEQAKAAVVEGLRHKSAGVRRAAVQVLPRDSWAAARMMDSLILGDADLQVRLAALLAAAETRGQRGLPVALARMLQAPENLNDPWLADALTAAAAANDGLFLDLVAVFKKPHTPRAHQIIGIVAEHYARGGPTTPHFLLPTLGVADPKTAEAILTGMARGWPAGKTVAMDAQAEAELSALLTRLPASAKAPLLKLAGRWGAPGLAKQLEEIARGLLTTVADEARPDAERLAAAQQVVETQPESADVAQKLLAAVTPRSSPQLSTGIIDALSASQAPTVGAALVKNMRGLSPTARAAALRVLLSRPESTRALLDGVDNGQVQLAELTLDQKQSLADHPNKAIARQARVLLERGGGLPSADRQKVIDQLTPVIAKSGDAKEGKLVFKKHCAVCHTHSGEGQKIGPDLTGMAVHPKHELLAQIMDPSRSVEGNYRLYRVVTEDGKVMNGLLASESKTALEIYDAEGKKHIVQRDNLSELVATAKSLMPDGFEKLLKENELLDLLEFLTERGKFLPLPLGKVATAVSTRGMFYSEDAPLERLIFKDWGPKTVEGVPFHLVDPEGERVPNVILFYGPQGKIPPKMPKSVALPCNAPAKAIHFLSGVSGWGYPFSEKGSVTLTVRLHYADGKSEDHALKNGEHFADYIRRVDVPGSKFAFALRGQQIRFLSVIPERADVIERIELVKGPDTTAPVVMAVTVETR